MCVLCVFMCIHGRVLSASDWEAVVKLSDDFNGADLRNVCTEAGETRCTEWWVVDIWVGSQSFL